MGIFMAPQPQLHQTYRDSELVIDAAVESSAVLAIEDGVAEVETRLRVLRSFKGQPADRQVLYRHSVYAADLASGDAGFAEGEKILAFLVRIENAGGAAEEHLYASVGYAEGILRPAGEERAAYLARLGALAELAKGQAGSDPGDFLEWLVATAEDPFTRGEAVPALAEALQAFADLAEEAGRSPILVAEELRQALGQGGAGGDRWRPAFLGALFGDEHRQRLMAALLATDSLNTDDRALLELVRSYHPQAAGRWLAESLERGDFDDAAELYWWMLDEAENLESPRAEAFAESAADRWEALADEDDADSIDAKRLALVRQLTAEMAALLEDKGRAERR